MSPVQDAPRRNSDKTLLDEAARIEGERRRAGLEGLVGGLEFVVINTEPARQVAAAREMLATTGFACREAFEDESGVGFVLSAANSADILIRSRKSGTNPFLSINDRQKTRHLPATRLETLVFRARDLNRYVEIQRGRGVRFLTDAVVENELYRFIQTAPSQFTGNSIGFVEWKGGGRRYAHAASRTIDAPKKPGRGYLASIGRIDHVATRVTAPDRDPAILEFMSLTNYRFDFAVYVEELNSITNVARLSKEEFALVFTSGISSPGGGAPAGPTERFVELYGPRVHHVALDTRDIEDTCDALARDGMRYLVELVGSPAEGLKQTFTVPSENTMLVTEYIRRYGDFDGFFTKSNVTILTAASGKAYGD